MCFYNSIQIRIAIKYIPTKTVLGSNLIKEWPNVSQQSQAVEGFIWPWTVWVHSAETSVLWEESRKFSANRKGADRVVQVEGKEELKTRGNTEPVTNILSLHRRPKKGREDSALSLVETTKDFRRATGNQVNFT